ncbi:hypothetical protein HK100_001400 [Physocladia obscura]|uniref:Uncharacterized protein n=1 Tax=Physocladia obscura TaxID=109957 RepID=A0AAD5SX65_9FUNG|nr:hypothetical protein HK100_001400 [Physocladia obscura]
MSDSPQVVSVESQTHTRILETGEVETETVTTETAAVTRTRAVEVEEEEAVIVKEEETVTEEGELDVAWLCDQIRANDGIAALDLNGSGLSTQDVFLIADAIKVNDSLEKLDLEDNDISPDGILAIAQAITINHGIRQISLGNQSTSLDTEIALANAIESNQTITSFTLTISDATIRARIDAALARNIETYNLTLRKTKKIIYLTETELVTTTRTAKEISGSSNTDQQEDEELGVLSGSEEIVERDETSVGGLISSDDGFVVVESVQTEGVFAASEQQEQQVEEKIVVDTHEQAAIETSTEAVETGIIEQAAIETSVSEEQVVVETNTAEEQVVDATSAIEAAETVVTEKQVAIETSVIEEEVVAVEPPLLAVEGIEKAVDIVPPIAGAVGESLIIESVIEKEQDGGEITETTVSDTIANDLKGSETVGVIVSEESAAFDVIPAEEFPAVAAADIPVVEEVAVADIVNSEKTFGETFKNVVVEEEPTIAPTVDVIIDEEPVAITVTNNIVGEEIIVEEIVDITVAEEAAEDEGSGVVDADVSVAVPEEETYVTEQTVSEEIVDDIIAAVEEAVVVDVAEKVSVEVAVKDSLEAAIVDDVVAVQESISQEVIVDDGAKKTVGIDVVESTIEVVEDVPVAVVSASDELTTVGKEDEIAEISEITVTETTSTTSTFGTETVITTETETTKDGIFEEISRSTAQDVAVVESSQAVVAIAAEQQDIFSTSDVAVVEEKSPEPEVVFAEVEVSEKAVEIDAVTEGSEVVAETAVETEVTNVILDSAISEKAVVSTVDEPQSREIEIIAPVVVDSDVSEQITDAIEGIALTDVTDAVQIEQEVTETVVVEEIVELVPAVAPVIIEENVAVTTFETFVEEKNVSVREDSDPVAETASVGEAITTVVKSVEIAPPESGIAEESKTITTTETETSETINGETVITKTVVTEVVVVDKKDDAQTLLIIVWVSILLVLLAILAVIYTISSSTVVVKEPVIANDFLVAGAFAFSKIIVWTNSDVNLPYAVLPRVFSHLAKVVPVEGLVQVNSTAGVKLALSRTIKSDKTLLLCIGSNDCTNTLISNETLLSLGSESFYLRTQRNPKTGETILAVNGLNAFENIKDRKPNSMRIQSVWSHGNRGLAYGVYAALEELGFAFLHPLAPTTPPSASLKSLNVTVNESPYWSKFRGIHYHTQHPLELTPFLQGFGPGGFDDEYGWEAQVPEFASFCEWLVANRQNAVEWPLLEGHTWAEFHRSEKRIQRLKKIADIAHSYGIMVGVDVPIAFAQQHSFRLLKDGKGTPEHLEAERNEIHESLDWVMRAGFDFLGTESGTSEFTHSSPQTMLDWMNAAADYVAEKYDITMFIKVHCSAGQTAKGFVDVRDGKDINFNMLPHFASKNLGVLPHTVEPYSLDDPAPTYGNKDFGYIREYLNWELENNERPVVFYPETAYWVSVDIDVPLFMPIYFERRLHDLRILAADQANSTTKKRMDGQLIFASGWEWGYWLNDAMAARAAWNPQVHIINDNDAVKSLLRPLTINFKFEEDRIEAENTLLEWVNAEKDLLIYGKLENQTMPDDVIRKNGHGYLEGWDTWDDVSKILGKLTQPDRLGLVEFKHASKWLSHVKKHVMKHTKRDVTAEYVGTVRALLVEMDAKFASLSNRTAAIAAKAPKYTADLWDDIADSARMTSLRAHQILSLYEFVHSVRKQWTGYGNAAFSKEAVATLRKAQKIVEGREKRYRVEAERVAGWTNLNTPGQPTAYAFNYLWTVRSLHYWWRDTAEALVKSHSTQKASFANIIDPVEVGIGSGVVLDVAQDFAEFLSVLGVAKNYFDLAEKEPHYPDDIQGWAEP